MLLTHGSPRSAFPGYWSLPGGTVEQGEEPGKTVVREYAAQAGLHVDVTGLRTVVADLARLPAALEHTDRILYDITVRGGTLADERGGTTDQAIWLTSYELAGLPMLPFTAAALGAGVPGPADAWLEAGADGVDLARPRAADGTAPTGPVAPPTRGQRFGAYALATDPAGRVLLTEIAAGYPGAGRWHLPGGGTDHGEAPERAVLRELVEETAQRGRVTGLLDVNHRYDPAALGPEGRPINWHVVRVLFRVAVDVPTEAVVTEAAGGSTRRARWFGAEELDGLPLTDATRWALPWYSAP